MKKEKQLVANIWETPDGTILWSRFRHDYVHYVDANGEEYSVDGGNDYCISLVNQEKMKSLCVYNTDPWNLQRQYILRGTFNRQGDRIWVPMSRLSNKHLENIVKDDKEYYGRKSTVWSRELNYRKKNRIVVEEHDYTNEEVSNIIKSV